MSRFAHMLWVMPIALVFLRCDDDPERPFVALAAPPRRAPEAPRAQQARTGRRGDLALRIGLGAMVTPQEGFKHYWRLVELLRKRLGCAIQLLDHVDYNALNEDLRQGRVDVAFVCSRPYVAGKEDFGLELLAAPMVNGALEYYSYVIVRQESPYQALTDLRGHSFAYVDLLSNTGRLAPRHALRAWDLDPENFFGEIVFTHGHDVSIRAVAHGLVDGAAVANLLWDYVRDAHPDATSRCRIIEKLGPYGIPPVVVRPDLPAELRLRIRSAFLSLHEDPEGLEILRSLHIDRFVEVEDSLYDSIRRQRDACQQGRPR